jgi:hypothetical protein
LTFLAATIYPANAHASLFKGETLDAVANGISWVAIIIAPLIGITIFLARPHFTGEDRREEKTSANQGDPMPLLALALLRRIALASRLALGLLEASAAQARLWYRCG